MKNRDILFFCLLIVLSCQRNELINCSVGELSAPEGYQISRIGEVSGFGDVNSLQFLNSSIGFAISGTHSGQSRFFQKTIDGGLTWILINLNTQGANSVTAMESIGAMAFKDKNTGFLSLVTVHCSTSDCHRQPKLLSTKDGGESWGERILNNVLGQVTQLQFEGEDLYGILYSEGANSIIKISNDGQSWETILSTDSIDSTEYIRTYKFMDDKILVVASNRNFEGRQDDNRLIKIDSSFEIDTIIKLDQNEIIDFQILNHDTFILAQVDQLSISKDGGLSWTIIHNGNAEFGGFESADRGFLFVEKGACQINIDAKYKEYMLSITTDGGSTWIEAVNTTANLGSDYGSCQNIGPEEWIISVGDELFRLSHN